LDDAPCDEHVDVYGERADQRSDEEDDDADHEDGLRRLALCREEGVYQLTLRPKMSLSLPHGGVEAGFCQQSSGMECLGGLYRQQGEDRQFQSR
jgi:hypothetical protein